MAKVNRTGNGNIQIDGKISQVRGLWFNFANAKGIRGHTFQHSGRTKERTQKEFLQFLYISYGSGAELETQVEICKRLPKLKDLDYTGVASNLEIIMKMLNGLIGSIKEN